MPAPELAGIVTIAAAIAAGCRDKAPATPPGPAAPAAVAAARDAPAPTPDAACAPPAAVVDGHGAPPTAAWFGAPGVGPLELARLREPMPLAEVRCRSPEVLAQDAARQEVAAGVMYQLVIDGETLTERGLSLTAPAIEALRAAWGPADQDCWFAADHRHRACLRPGVGAYPWRDLELTDYVPLTEQLGPTPGSLPGVPRLVGIPMHELEGGPYHGFTIAQPPGAPPPGKSGELVLPATEWGYPSRLGLHLAADAALTVESATFAIAYRGDAARDAVLGVLVARWGDGARPAIGAPGAPVVLHASTPRIEIRDVRSDEGGRWDVSIAP